jgi:hypothetical protein
MDEVKAAKLSCQAWCKGGIAKTKSRGEMLYFKGESQRFPFPRPSGEYRHVVAALV